MGRVTAPSESRPSGGFARLVPAIRRVTGGGAWKSQFLRGLFWKYRRLAVMALVVNVLAAVLEGGTMGMLGLAVESLMGGSGGLPIAGLGRFGAWIQEIRASLDPVAAFSVLVGIACASQIVKALAEFTSASIGAQLTTSMAADLRMRTFRQLSRMRYQEISRYRVGDMASYMNQAARAASVVPMANAVAYQTLVVMAYGAAQLWNSWRLSLVALVALGILVFATRGILTRIRTASRQFVVSSTRMTESAVEFLGAIRHVHTYDREAFATDLVDRDIAIGRVAQRRGAILGALIPFSMQATAALGVGVLLYVSTLFVVDGAALHPINVLFFVAVLFRMLPRITNVNGQVAKLFSAWAFVERISDILRRDDKTFVERGGSDLRRIEQGVGFRDVTFKYDVGAESVAVVGLDFEVPRGTMTALVGPSGAGKSTVVNLLLRLYDATGGEITVDGRPIESVAISDWRGRIGLVDQDTFILHSTVRENIRFGRLDATDAEIEDAARIASAHDFIMELAQGYDTVVGERGMRLSGGQRQRVAIARAIVRRPDLLILDEATSALDTHSERAIQDAIERIRQDFTVVAIAHRLSTIRHADQILVLDEGQIVERGTHDDLVAAGGLYATLWSAQSDGRSAP